MIVVEPKVRAPLDGGFEPSVLWNREYSKRAKATGEARPFSVAVGKSDSILARVETQLGPETSSWVDTNYRYVERLVKSLLYVHGGHRIIVAGCDAIAARLAADYTAEGNRQFDADMLGTQIFLAPFEVQELSLENMPSPTKGDESSWGRHLEGCRIGFDLGGSDRKAAAIIDGKVVFSEEIEWNPYFQSDVNYHLNGIRDSLQRAAKHLPRVDAVGGSAAGVYVDNEVRAASLFRGIPAAQFGESVRRIFFRVMDSLGWSEIPWGVVNDGEVAALAGSMAIGGNGLLGLSMGTSFAAGYVTPSGKLSSRLNELAFMPIDHRPEGPVDEWSGDVGCGVQFFSQQGVARLAKLAGIAFDDSIAFPERLIEVQRLVVQGDSRAESIFRTIGVNFGYAIAQFAELYALEHLLILGRVTSGEGGGLILKAAREVLDLEFPEISEAIQFHLPDEKQKRHGQAIAVASLPAISN
ncbi:MAG: hypothetical protein M2R45_03217 [Verrucomicrobia subdivision 3 bacterium]|nr:hypothetical protein [Limisphaerales bacterium]MCS1413932.1 hypothetical protein [Limisphaerales bacterium]